MMLRLRLADGSESDLDELDVRAQLADGRLTGDELVWREGATSWLSLRALYGGSNQADVPELRRSPHGELAGEANPLPHTLHSPVPTTTQRGMAEDSPNLEEKSPDTRGEETSPTETSAPTTEATGTEPANNPPTRSATSVPLTKRFGPTRNMAIAAAGGLTFLLVLVTTLLVYRNSYQRGLVLEHVPGDCAYFGYLDLQGIAESDPVKPLLERTIKNTQDMFEDTFERKSRKQKQRFQRAVDALAKNGIETTSIRELAVCVPQGDTEGVPSREKTLLLIGGTFRKGNVLKAIEDAIESARGDDEICKLEKDDGQEMLKCSIEMGMKREPVYAMLVDSRVLGISLDRRMLRQARPIRDRSKTYGANKGEHLVFMESPEAAHYDGSFGSIRLKMGPKDVALSIEQRYDEKRGRSKLDDMKDPEAFARKREEALRAAASTCFDKPPFEMLGDAVDRAKVEALENGIRYEYKASNKDIGKLMRVLSDAEMSDFEKLSDVQRCVSSAMDGRGPMPERTPGRALPKPGDSEYD